MIFSQNSGYQLLLAVPVTDRRERRKHRSSMLLECFDEPDSAGWSGFANPQQN
jgi:hypothetical protein